jgi:superfamily II DNA or RNA helicase
MSKIIIKDYIFANIQEEDPAFFKKVNKFLSFKQEGVEYSPAYRNTGWDGVTYLIDKKHNFYNGLVSMVEEFYKDNGKNLIIEDARPKYIPEPPLDIYPKLKEIGKPPRDYQEEAAELALSHYKGIIRAATGGGKTLLASLIAAKLNKPIIIGVIGLSLMQQFYETFSEIFEEEIGLVGGGVCRIRRINIVSIWTLAKALDISDKDMFILDESVDKEKFDEKNKHKIIKMLDDTKVIILDECHSVTTNSARSIIREAKGVEKVFGLSGTPYKNDGTDLITMGILGEKIIDISADRLIKSGVLVPPIIKFVTVPSCYVKGSTYPEVYKEYIIDGENGLIATDWYTEIKYMIENPEHRKEMAEALTETIAKAFDPKKIQDDRYELYKKLVPDKGEAIIVTI